MIVGAIVVVVGVLVLIFLNIRPKPANTAVAKLMVWGTEDQNTFAPLLSSYPYATVTYTQIDPANYQSQLVSALAAGDGPDVFEIGNRALPQWQSILAPLPAAYATEFSSLQMQNDFPDVVAEDFAPNGTIYGLPLSIDTLAMLYNKDLFNSAGIAFPPKTWDDFDNDVVKLRAVGASGELTQSAAAIGGSEASIPNASDILSLLMLQNGTEMTNADFTSAEFSSGSGQGLAAFNFYLQFAKASSPYYTWNDSMGNAADSVVAGKTAIMFGYESDLAAIKAKAPFLNIGIAAVPQPTGASVAVNYPKYEGFVAAKAGTQVNLAWNFILYLTTNEGFEKMYVSATGNPPALRTEIQADMNDQNLSVFASQALTAKSWHEANDAQIDAIFNSAIQSVLNGNEDSTKALQQAEQSVTQLM